MLSFIRNFEMTRIGLETLERVSDVSLKINKNKLIVKSTNGTEIVDMSCFRMRMENQEFILENSHSLYSFR